MFDPAIVDVILIGVGGLSVLGVTEIVKRFLKATGVGAILISLVVSASFTAYYLLSTGTFSVLSMVGYSLLVFASANGIFKATHTPSA
jgi:hypothetical protein